MAISTVFENFIAISQRMTCSKVLFIFHQPYLRSTRWPQISRQKAIEARTCFSVFGGNDESSWGTTEVLRRKAWAANKWALDARDDAGCDSISVSLSGWDPLFASFTCDDDVFLDLPAV